MSNHDSKKKAPPFQPYRGNEPFIFVSYSHLDDPSVFGDLQWLYDLGYRLWYDEGTEPGREWRERIGETIARCAFFIVFMSKNAVDSMYMRSEINYAVDNHKPFLAIHIEETKVTPGLAMSLNSLQAIMKYQISVEQYHKKLDDLLPAVALSLADRTQRQELTHELQEGKNAFHHKDYDRAKIHFDRVQELDSGNPEANDFKHRIDEFEKTFLRNKRLRALIYSARYALKQEDYVSAKDHVERALDLEPDNDEATRIMDQVVRHSRDLFVLGEQAYLARRYEEARQHLEQHLKLYPVPRAQEYLTALGRRLKERELTEEYELLCPGCFRHKGNQPRCPSCGYDEDRTRSPDALPPRSVLADRYIIGRVLNESPSGITYLASDFNLRRPVFIKEFFPRNSVIRDPEGTILPSATTDATGHIRSINSLLEEVRKASHVEHPSIARVHGSIRANNTAYVIVEFVEGMFLEEHLNRSDGKIDEAAALGIMLPILEGLASAHEKRLVHGEIGLGSVYLSKEGKPILLDLGATLPAIPAEVLHSPCADQASFAAPEKYESTGRECIGPWTDIYSCGALLYRMVTGQLPSRTGCIPPRTLVPALSPSVSQAIVSALEAKTASRPPSAEEFRRMLLKEKPDRKRVKSTGPGPESPSLARTTSFKSALAERLRRGPMIIGAGGDSTPARHRTVTCTGCGLENRVTRSSPLVEQICERCGENLKQPFPLSLRNLLIALGGCSSLWLAGAFASHILLQDVTLGIILATILGIPAGTIFCLASQTPFRMASLIGAIGCAVGSAAGIYLAGGMNPTLINLITGGVIGTFIGAVVGYSPSQVLSLFFCATGLVVGETVGGASDHGELGAIIGALLGVGAVTDIKPAKLPILHMLLCAATIALGKIFGQLFGDVLGSPTAGGVVGTFGGALPVFRFFPFRRFWWYAALGVLGGAVAWLITQNALWAIFAVLAAGIVALLL